MAALMIVGTVPLYNIIAVVVLSLTAPQAEGRPKPNRKALLLKTLKNVATNPIILGIVVGMLWLILRIPDRKADCHFGDVGQCNNWKLFCHGKKYGTSWNINRLFCYDDNPVQCIYIDDVVIYFADAAIHLK